MSLTEDPLDSQGLSTHAGRAEGQGLVQCEAEIAFERNLNVASQHLQGSKQED